MTSYQRTLVNLLLRSKHQQQRREVLLVGLLHRRQLFDSLFIRFRPITRSVLVNLRVKLRDSLAVRASISRCTAITALSFFQAIEKTLSSDESRLLAEVDKLHDSDRAAEAYAKLQAVLASSDGKESAEFFWRMAREARALANSVNASDQERKRLTYEAFAMAQRGLELDPSSSSCHKWMGILLELTSRYEGTKQRIHNSFLVKEHFLKALESNSEDAVLLHCLGVWCFEVTDLPWYQQKLAAAFFAAPPTSTYDEALKFLLRAEQIDPNFYSSNLLYIGKAYLRKGDKQNARLYLQRAASYSGDSFDDQESKKEATQLLKSC